MGGRACTLASLCAVGGGLKVTGVQVEGWLVSSGLRYIRFSVLCFPRDAGGIFVLAEMAALKIEFKILARWRGVDLWVERPRKW